MQGREQVRAVDPDVRQSRAGDMATVPFGADPRHHRPAPDRLLEGRVSRNGVADAAELVDRIGPERTVATKAGKLIVLVSALHGPIAANGEDLALAHRMLPIDLPLAEEQPPVLDYRQVAGVAGPGDVSRAHLGRSGQLQTRI